MDYFSNKIINLLAFAGGTGATITSIVFDNLPAVMYWVVGGGMFLILKVMKARQDMRHREQTFRLEMRLKTAQIEGAIKDLSNESD